MHWKRDPKQLRIRPNFMQVVQEVWIKLAEETRRLSREVGHSCSWKQRTDKVWTSRGLNPVPFAQEFKPNWNSIIVQNLQVTAIEVYCANKVKTTKHTICIFMAFQILQQNHNLYLTLKMTTHKNLSGLESWNPAWLFQPTCLTRHAVTWLPSQSQAL